MLRPSSLASSQSWRTTSGLQKPVPRVARRHRDELVVGAEVLLPQPAGVGAVRGQDAARVVRPEPPVRERRVAEAVGEHRPDAGVLQPLDRRVRVVRRVHDVRPVHERRDARVDALERAPAVRREHVVRPVVRSELVEDRAEVGDQREVRGARPDRRLPRVAVGVDEARDHDVAGGIDDPRAVRRQVRPDGGDGVAVDEDVGLRQLAEGRVLGQDDRVLDEDPVSHGCLLDATTSVTTVGAGARPGRRPLPA